MTKAQRESLTAVLRDALAHWLLIGVGVDGEDIKGKEPSNRLDDAARYLCGAVEAEELAGAYALEEESQREYLRRSTPSSKPQLSYEMPLRRFVRVAKATYVERVVQGAGGNITEAARQLGIHRASIPNIMRVLKEKPCE